MLRFSVHARVGRVAALGLLAGFFAGASASAAEAWRWSVSLESARPSGWIQVRENDLEGTRLYFRDDLGVDRRNGVRFAATKTLSARSRWQWSLATYTLDGTTVLPAPIAFNGATIAPGALRTATDYTHFLKFDASYWRRLTTFRKGGGLWGSVGGTVTLLNFTLHGAVAPGSVGSETREDFYVQELPVPVVGLHLTYPLGRAFSLISSAELGRLPRVYSQRHEGGKVKLKQTNDALSVGVAFRPSAAREWSFAVFDRNYAQDEQSLEDGNVIHLRDRGLRVALAHPF